MASSSLRMSFDGHFEESDQDANTALLELDKGMWS